MKTTSTLKKFFLRKEGWMTVIVLAAFLFFGCYEFYSIDQPTDAYTNDTFEVPIVVKADDTPGNDFTVDGLQALGLFGVLVPDGWSVSDSIYYQIVASDSAYDGNGQIVYADKDYSNDGYLIYNENHSQMLLDSIGAPAGYHWWGAKTDSVADMTFFDSLYFTVKISTDAQTGTFYLQYAIGDEENPQRVPQDDVSDPLPITITENPNTSANSILDEAKLSVYPNPTHGQLNIVFNNFDNQSVELWIYDLAGKTVLTKTLNSASSTIDLSGQHSGVYFVRLKSGNVSKNIKVLLR